MCKRVKGRFSQQCGGGLLRGRVAGVRRVRRRCRSSCGWAGGVMAEANSSQAVSWGHFALRAETSRCNRRIGRGIGISCRRGRGTKYCFPYWKYQRLSMLPALPRFLSLSRLCGRIAPKARTRLWIPPLAAFRFGSRGACGVRALRHPVSRARLPAPPTPHARAVAPPAPQSPVSYGCRACGRDPWSSCAPYWPRGPAAPQRHRGYAPEP